MTAQDLFSELKIGGVTLSNRIAVAPMSQYSAVEGVPTPWHWQHLGSLSLGGAGLLMIEFCAVAMDGRLSHGCLALSDEKQERALQDLVRGIKALSPSIRVGLQLGHSGRKGSTRPPWAGGAYLSRDEAPWQTIGPSAISFRDDAAIPTEMTETSISELRDSFRQATQRALRCDIDVLEIHAVHGSLLHQFLSPLSNQRVDAYGNDGRSRLLREIVDDMRAVWPRDRALGVRLGVTDGVAGGLAIEDGLAVAAEIAAQGIDYLCVSSGGLVFPAPIPQESGYQIGLARAVRQLTTIPVRTSGLIADAELADRIIREGDADFIAVGRGFIDDPRWGWHAARKLGVVPWRPQQYTAVSEGRWPALLKSTIATR